MPQLFIPLTSESSLLSKDIIHNQTQGGTDGNPHAGAAAVERVDQKISASDTTPPGLDKNDLWIDTANLALKYNTGATGNTEQFTGSIVSGSDTVSTALTDPIGMDLTVEGNQTNTAQTASFTDQARTDRQSLTVGGNTDPENVSFTVTGKENTAAQSYSTTLANGGSDTVTPEGNQDATGSLTFTGTESTIGSGSFSETGVTDGQSISYSVGGNTAPRDATVTLTGKSESAARGPVAIADSESATVDPQGTRVEDATVTFTGIKNTQSVTKTGSSAESSVAEVGGNQEPTGPANGDPEISIQMGPAVESQDSAALGDLLSYTYTVPSKYDGAELNEVFTTVYGNDGEQVSVTFNRNGAQFASASGDFTFGQYSTSYIGVSETVSEGDQITITADGGSDLDYFNFRFLVDATGTTTVSTDTGLSTTITDSGSKAIDLSAGDTVSITHSGDGIESWSLTYDEVTQTKDPSLTVDGETVSHSGTLSDGETVTKTLTGLTPGSHTADVSVSGPLSTSLSWTDVTETTDPSISIGNSNVSHSGLLSPGQSVTESVSIPSSGSNSASVSVTGPVDIDGSWTEVQATEDPAVDVDGTSVSHTGVLAAGETASPSTSVTLSQAGSTLSATTNGEDVGVDVDYTAVTHPEDIQITDVTSGQVAVSNGGILSPGTSMSDTYTGLPNGDVTLEVDGANLTPPPLVDWDIAYDEVTASDVTVLLDGEETPVGILKSGETQTVSTTPRNLSGSLTFEINDAGGQSNSYTLDLEEASFVKLS